MTSTEYNVDGKLFKGIISMCANSLACVRVKGGESECFSIGSGVREGCVVPLTFQRSYGCSNERNKNGEGEGKLRVPSVSLVNT